MWVLQNSAGYRFIDEEWLLLPESRFLGLGKSWFPIIAVSISTTFDFIQTSLSIGIRISTPNSLDCVM